jgi:hypothetical protein
MWQDQNACAIRSFEHPGRLANLVKHLNQAGRNLVNGHGTFGTQPGVHGKTEAEAASYGARLRKELTSSLHGQAFWKQF